MSSKRMPHSAKRHNLGLFAQMGGAFDRAYFLLELFGEALDPGEVGRALRRRPTKSYRKGDETTSGTQFRTMGGWILSAGPERSRRAEALMRRFERWIARLPRDRAVWRDLCARFDVRVRLVGYTKRWNAEFHVSSAALRGLADRGLRLVVDPYLELDDEA